MFPPRHNFFLFLLLFLLLIMPSRGLAFWKEEIDFFLELMEEILPISSMEWDDIERRHNEKYATNERTKETLRRKFQNLYLKRVPTGDPTMPPEIRRAKKIQNNIKHRADISEGEDTEEDGEDEAFVEESQEEEIQQDAINNGTLLTPMASTVALGNNRKQKSASENVFKVPMLRVGSRSLSANPFENVMKYVMKKDLEMKPAKQEDDDRRDREREERRKN